MVRLYGYITEKADVCVCLPHKTFSCTLIASNRKKKSQCDICCFENVFVYVCVLKCQHSEASSESGPSLKVGPVEIYLPPADIMNPILLYLASQCIWPPLHLSCACWENDNDGNITFGIYRAMVCFCGLGEMPKVRGLCHRPFGSQSLKKLYSSPNFSNFMAVLYD